MYGIFHQQSRRSPAIDGDGIFYWRTWEEAATHDPEAAAIIARYRQRPREELYDLDADPDELQNLADDPRHAERLKSFRSELDAWLREQGDDLPVFDEPLMLGEDATPLSMRGSP